VLLLLVLAVVEEEILVVLEVVQAEALAGKIIFQLYLEIVIQLQLVQAAQLLQV
jgi:hypothetical protein